MKNKKRFSAIYFAGILAASSLLAYSSSMAAEPQDALSVSIESAAEATAAAETAAFEQKLSSLEGVVKVTPVAVSEANQENDRFLGRYVVEFEQPIDWNNPEDGKFTQRAFVGYAENADVTCYHTSGYILQDILAPDYFETCDVREDFKDRYTCSFVDFEYRFFGESAPEGLSFDDAAYWEFMTSENASKDFHHMITELKKVLGGKTVFYGESKGGYSAESMACCFPDDIDAYVSYVAPLCDGVKDSRLYENIYHTIGDLDPKYGAEGAAKNRETVKALQLILLDPRVREQNQRMLMDALAQAGYHLSPLVTEDEAYEVSVAEFGASIWQMLPEFEILGQVAAIPEDTEEAFLAKNSAIANIYLALMPQLFVSYDSYIAPYYFQSYMEMGNYCVDFSALREAGAVLNTPPENEEDLLMRIFGPTIVKNNMKYDDTCRRELIHFMNTTEKDIIKIVGLSDPWYVMKAPVTENEHIHLYEVSGTHSTGIFAMEPEMQTECYGLLDALLGIA